MLGSQRAPVGPDAEYLIELWQTDDGLPQSTVTTVLQTRDGYLWLGTQKGLVRFDGVGFRVFDSANTPAMTTSRIVKLFEDRRGTLWVGTENEILQRTPTGFVGFRPPDLGTAHNYPRTLCDDEEGNLWLVSCEWRLLRLQGGTFSVVSDGWPLADREARFAVENPAGGIWVGTRGEVASGVGGRFRTEWQMKRPDYVAGQALCPSRRGGVWAVDGPGTLRRIQNGRVEEEFHASVPLHDFTFQILEDRAGNVWVANSGSGLLRFSPDGREHRLNRRSGLPTDFVRSVAEDREGNIWVGTEGGGLCRLKPAFFSVYSERSGLAADQVVSVHAGSGGKSVWVGLNGGYLDRVTPGTGVEHFGTGQSLWDGHVWSVVEDSRGDLWAGTWGGFFWRGRDRQEFVRVSDEQKIGWQVLALYEDPRGGIWVGQQGMGALAFIRDGVTNAYRIPGAAAAMDVRCLTRDAAGAMWFGTAGDGLYRVEEERATRFARTNGLPSEVVWSLLAEPDGTVWIGTSGGGISRWRAGELRSFGLAEGMPNDTVSQIFPEGADHLWMGTHGGIFRVAKREIEAVARGAKARFEGIRFDKSDGLPTLECSGAFQPSVTRTADGRWWIPTSRGLVGFDPARLRSNPLPPPVRLEEAVVDGRVQELSAGTPLRLAPGRHRVELRFAALSFTAPERVRSRYRLEGVEDQWVDAGAGRKAEYSQLLPGRYRFRVQACNHDGVWNETGAECELVQLPFFWQTLWFQGSSAVGLLGLVSGLGWKLSRRQIERRLAAAERERRLAEERERAAGELRASHERYLRVVETGFDGVVISQDGLLKHVNESLATMLGVTVPDLVGQSAGEFVAPEDRELVLQRQRARQAQEPGIPAIYSIRLRRRDGSVIWVEVKGASVEWQGRPAVLTLIHDITERRQAEEERLRLERQLRQAQKLEAIGTLAGGIAHDFNNILTGIFGYLALVRDTVGDRPDVQEDLREIDLAARRARDLVRQILTFSRRDLGAFEPVAPAPIFREALGLLQATLPKTAQLETELSEPLPLVVGSPTQLHQVVMNLCTNAAQALVDGHGTIRVRVFGSQLPEPELAGLAEVPAGPVLVIEVSDDGCGMDPETLERMFDPFFTTKPRERGTGLGLSMVLGIVQTHQGAIRVRSTVGKGTCFTVTLPAMATVPVLPPTVAVTGGQGGGERILVVEDELSLGLVMARALTAAGFRPLVFSSSRQALEEFRRNGSHYSLVVTDFNMPELNGADLVAALRALAPTLPIVMTSGAIDRLDEARVQQLGGQRFLRKPFTPPELVRAVILELEPRGT